MSVYQSSDGSWIYFDGETKFTNLTAAEAYEMARQEEYILEVKAAATALWDALNTLKNAQTEWNALGYGDNLMDYQGYTKAEVGAVVFDTTNAFIAVRDGTLDAGALPGAMAANLAALL